METQDGKNEKAVILASNSRSLQYYIFKYLSQLGTAGRAPKKNPKNLREGSFEGLVACAERWKLFKTMEKH